jgi:hypothetical protein
MDLTYMAVGLTELVHISVLGCFYSFLFNQQKSTSSDNELIVSVQSSGSSKGKRIVAIIREFFLLTSA